MSINYYEVLDLPCDGKSADDIKLIERTLKQWEITKTDALNNETQEAKRRVLQAELAELPNMKKLTSDATLRKTHAEELKNIRMKQVDSIIGVMSKSRTANKSVAKARLDKIAGLIGLLPATVAKRYKESGYTVVESKPVNTNDFLMEARVLNKIDGDMELIRNHMKSNPYEPLQEIATATNLYEYIAIMEGKTVGEASEYKHMPTDQLNALFNTKMMEHVKTTAPTMWYKSIESQAKTQVMKDDKQREKYNNALKLKELQGLLDMLSTVPVSVKLERVFAEECIKEIQGVFSDEDQAIAIYNKYGEMPQDSLYEKENTSIATMCTCHIINYHDTREQAEHAKCVSCGMPLYERCPSCGKMVPAIAEFCSCGFFMMGKQNFELHRLRFEAAVKAMDFERARDEYDVAKVSDPSNAKLVEMKKKLDELEEIYKKPVEDIKSLLAQKKINAALQKINAFKAARPGANVKQYLDQANTELAWAAAEYAKLQRVTSEGQGVELASRIVERVKDYTPALEWLRLHKPKPVRQVVQVGNHDTLSCVLQWTDDPDNRFVTYTVVRKEGAKPLNVKDGVVVGEELKSNQLRDEKLVAGKIYAYAVFAVRGDTPSAPAYSSAVCLMKNIDEVQVNITQNACTLSWKDIPGSRGVHIRRSEDGGATYALVNACARGMFTDTRIANGKQYRYAFRTIWDVQGKAMPSPKDFIRDVKVEQKPPRVDIAINNVGSDGNCEVSWNASGDGALCLVALKNGINVVPDQVYSMDMLNGMGDIIVRAVPVRSGKYAWYAKLGRQFNVAAFRIFGDDTVGGNAVRISTVPALNVDENRTIIANNSLQLYIQDVPQDVKKLFYLVSVNGTVASEKMAVQGNLPGMDIETFRRSGMISVENLPQEKLTVSVMAMYGTGSGAYFSPVTTLSMSNLPKQKLEYWIEWQTKGFRRKLVRTGAKLIVRTEADRIPQMSLCCRDDGRMIFNYIPGTPGIVELLRIDSRKADAGTEYEYEISANAMRGMPDGTDIQLFLDKKELNNYATPVCTNPASRKMPAE